MFQKSQKEGLLQLEGVLQLGEYGIFNSELFVW